MQMLRIWIMFSSVAASYFVFIVASRPSNSPIVPRSMTLCGHSDPKKNRPSINCSAEFIMAIKVKLQSLTELTGNCLKHYWYMYFGSPKRVHTFSLSWTVSHKGLDHQRFSLRWRVSNHFSAKPRLKRSNLRDGVLSPALTTGLALRVCL